MSLPLIDKSKFAQAWNDQISILGIQATFRKGGVDTPVSCGFAKPRDNEVVNAYNEEDRIVTLRNIDISTTPEKFDVIILANGDEYAIKEVHQVFLNDIALGWRCVVSG